MEILKKKDGYEEKILELLYAKYKIQIQNFKAVHLMSKEVFKAFYSDQMQEAESLLVIHNEELVGVLFYFTWQEGETRYCEIPLIGYAAKQENEEKYIGVLFQKLAEKYVNAGKTYFSIHVYAKDEKIKQLFSYMQFGMMAETGIRKIETKYKVNTSVQIRTLNKTEITQRWHEVWQLTRCIIDHLKTSPIFYKGDEFTEEVYQEFFMDQGTSVHIAFDKNDKMIGMIESNKDTNPFVFGKEKATNIGEAYVISEYRGSGLAQDLLNFAQAYERQYGAIWAWVEHGTANPNARGFWNKYFETYTYEMVREVVL